MAISYVWSSTAAFLNGGSVVLAIPPSSVQTDDVVVAWGGKPGRAAGTVGPVAGLSYTSIYTTGAVATGPNAWYGFKIMGATPDSSFVGGGSDNANDGTAYGLYIFRGVSSVVLDTAPMRAGGNSTNPNPPSVITTTANVVNFIPAVKQQSDTAFFSVLGYSNFQSANANDNLDVSIGGNWASIVSAGSTDPGAYQGWAGTSSWVAMSIPLREYIAPQEPDPYQSFIGMFAVVPKRFRGVKY